MRYVLSTLLILLGLYAVPVEACTTFAVRNGDQSIGFVGRSYDWNTQAALVIANTKGIHKRAIAFPPPAGTSLTQLPGVNWRTQYSSITFNQYGRDFAAGGMNTEGLVVETMEMDPSGSNEPDVKATTSVYDPNANESISELQWVQYILDNFESVDAFLRNLPVFAIVPGSVYIHYLICDNRQCAVAEIKQNKLFITIGAYPDPPLSIPSELADYVTVVIDTQNPPVALANDFYDCSVSGRDAAHTLALLDYLPWGGSMTVPSGPAAINNYCQVLPFLGSAAAWCDYACRKSGSAWASANSVERFVRATAGSESLSAKKTTVDDVFTELDQVFSEDPVTGGTVWQIVYDIPHKRVYWRTIADGEDPATGFLGKPRSLGFDDVGSGGSDCSTSNVSAMVVNVDQAPPCSDLFTCGPHENPNPDLPSCTPGQTSGCRMQAYEPIYNRNLVKFSANPKHSTINVSEFLGLVEQLLPQIDATTAEAIMYNVWGGYPDGLNAGDSGIGFTQCGADVTSDNIVNLYLESSLDPYINPLIQNKIANTVDFDKKINVGAGAWHTFLSDTCAAITSLEEVWPTTVDSVYYEVKGSASGLDGFTLTSLKASSQESAITMAGKIPELSSDPSLRLYCRYHRDGSSDKKTYEFGAVDFGFKLTDTIFDGTTTGVTIHSDASYCLEKDATTSVAVATDGALVVWPCSFTLSGYTVNSDLLSVFCLVVAYELEDVIVPASSGSISSVINDYFLPVLPQCDTATVAEAYSPPKLTASWGDLDGQSLTTQVGQPIQLEAQIIADRHSRSHEFAIFREAFPGGGNSLPIGTVRMTVREGVNSVKVNWTPTTVGNKDLHFDVARWDEETDEVEPAVLRVRVSPEGSGCNLLMTGARVPFLPVTLAPLLLVILPLGAWRLTSARRTAGARGWS